MNESSYKKKFGKMSLFYLPETPSYDAIFTNELDEESMKDVVKAYFKSIQTEDLSWISLDFPNVEELNLESTKKLKSLKGIEKLSKLTSISIQSTCTELIEFGSLVNDSLKKIFIDVTSTELPLLSKSVESLIIYDCNKLKNFDFLSNLCDGTLLCLLNINPALKVPERFNNAKNRIQFSGN